MEANGIKIGNRVLGAGHPTFIIAEIGSNWRALDDCLKSIELCALAGADAVKFQHFRADELYGFRAGESLEHELPASWIPDLAKCCQQHGVEFMCTAFSPAGISRVDPYVAAHKIASLEVTDPGIMQTAMATGKPVFVSTGALVRHELLELSANWNPAKVIPMYCRVDYPARDSFPALIEELGVALGCRFMVGFSDHSTDICFIPYAGKMFGAVAIEKHVNAVYAQGPDAPHSLSIRDFGRMVDTLRGRCDAREIPSSVLEMRRRFQPELGGFYRTRIG